MVLSTKENGKDKNGAFIFRDFKPVNESVHGDRTQTATNFWMQCTNIRSYGQSDKMLFNSMYPFRRLRRRAGLAVAELHVAALQKFGYFGNVAVNGDCAFNPPDHATIGLRK